MGSNGNVAKCLPWLTLAFSVVFAAVASAQGPVAFRYNGIVIQLNGRPAAGAQVRVCQQGAAGVPCTPLATIYADGSGTTQMPNPTATDSNGLYFFYATPGLYVIQVTDPFGRVYTLPDTVISGPTSGTVISTGTMDASGNFPCLSGASIVYAVTLTANVTSTSLCTPSVGQMLTFVVCQNQVGGFSFTWPTGLPNPPGVPTAPNSCATAVYVYTPQGFTPIYPPQLSGLPAQSANTFFAGPSSGAPAAPSFRSIVPADLPAGGSCPPGQFAISLGAQLQPVCASPAPSGGLPITIQLPNDTTGTTLYHVAKILPSGKVANADPSDYANIVGIVTAGAGTTGNATITILGNATCAFQDNNGSGNTNIVQQGDYVTIEPGGFCLDYGMANFTMNGAPGNTLIPPQSLGAPFIGIVQTTSASPGNYTVQVAIPPAFGGTLYGGSWPARQYVATFGTDSADCSHPLRACRTLHQAFFNVWNTFHNLPNLPSFHPPEVYVVDNSGITEDVSSTPVLMYGYTLVLGPGSGVTFKNGQCAIQAGSNEVEKILYYPGASISADTFSPPVTLFCSPIGHAGVSIAPVHGMSFTNLAILPTLGDDRGIKIYPGQSLIGESNASTPSPLDFDCTGCFIQENNLFSQSTRSFVNVSSNYFACRYCSIWFSPLRSVPSWKGPTQLLLEHSIVRITDTSGNTLNVSIFAISQNAAVNGYTNYGVVLRDSYVLACQNPGVPSIFLMDDVYFDFESVIAGPSPGCANANGQTFIETLAETTNGTPPAYSILRNVQVTMGTAFKDDNRSLTFPGPQTFGLYVWTNPLAPANGPSGPAAAVYYNGLPWPKPAGAAFNVVRQTLSSSLGLNFGQNTILTANVTMPSSGCPCRVLVQYGLFIGAGSSSTWDAWVTDGTNVFAQVDGQTTDATQLPLSSSEMTYVTYNNSQTVTFSLIFNRPSGTTGTWTANPTPHAGSEPTWMTLTVIPTQ
jgi:hypothetical protein